MGAGAALPKDAGVPKPEPGAEASPVDGADCSQDSVNCCCWEGPSVTDDGVIWACAAVAQRTASDKMRVMCLNGMIQFVYD